MKHKAVLIISDESDQTTNRVMDWLFKWQVPVIRINDTSSLFLEHLILDNEKVRFRIRVQNVISQECVTITEDDIQSVWYRRGQLHFSPDDYLDEEMPVPMKRYLNHEKKKLTDFFYTFFTTQFKSLNTFFDNDINKLDVLYKAAQCGIKTPFTLVSAAGEVIKNELKGKAVITKSIDYSFILDSHYRHFGYTSVFQTDTLPDNTTCFPSQFQENMDKKYELRIFYLDKKCYSSAILSQSDEKTQTDFRNYNLENPNRVVPYTLPECVEKKLVHLMELLKMNSGSIDLIVTNSNEYVFLEVNPIGQFWQVSYPCSYELEEKVAHYLAN